MCVQRDDEEHCAPTICHSERNFALEAASSRSHKADSEARIFGLFGLFAVRDHMENGNERDLNPN